MGNGFNWACTWLYCVSNCIFVGVHSCLVLIRPREDATDGLRADWQQQFFVSLKMVDYCVLFFSKKKSGLGLFGFFSSFGFSSAEPIAGQGRPRSICFRPLIGGRTSRNQSAGPDRSHLWICGSGAAFVFSLSIVFSFHLLVCSYVFFGRLVCWWARSRDPSQTSEMSETEQSKATAISGSEK